MSLEDNKLLVRRLYEVGMTQRDLDLVERSFAPNYTVYYPGVPPIRGRDAAMKALRGFLDAFPDISFIVEDQIAEGDKVTTRWTASGTHLGEFRGFPTEQTVILPSRRPVAFNATDIYLIADGQIVEEWNTLDPLLVLNQVGAVTVH